MDGDDPRIPPRCQERAREKFQITNFSTPNNFSFMKHAEISVPGLADNGVPYGDGDGPRTAHRCIEGVWKKSQMTNFYMLNKFSSMK